MCLHRRAAHLLFLLPVLGLLLPARGAAGGTATVPGEPCVTPVLVRDSASGSPLPAPSLLVDVGGTLFFAVSESSNGLALWKSDGTASGAVRVKGPPAWETTAALGHFTAVGSRLFFTVSTSSNSVELWVSDGTAAGTLPLKSFPSQGLALEAELIAVGPTLFFSASDGSSGFELWRSDGTPATTRLVRDIVAGAGSSSPSGLTAMNGQVFFAADDGSSGAELWKSDGTAAGTVRVKDIRPGVNGSLPGSLRVMEGVLYFTATDGTDFNATLWKSDGTAAGTGPVAPMAFDASHDAPQELTVAGRTLFFRLRDNVYGAELWKSDGTAAGTQLVKDLQAGFFDSDPQQLTAVGDRVFFLANDGQSGLEPWKSDGTAAGTTLVRDFIPGSSGPLNPVLTAGPGGLLAQINDGISGSELWKSDGAGTVQLTDINPQSASSEPRLMTISGGKLFFVATHPTLGDELFVIPLNEVDCFAPVITCPSNQEVEAISAQGAFFSLPPSKVFDDAVTPPAMSFSWPPEGLFPMGDTVVSITARDAAGNSQACTFHVNVQDKTPPLLLCPKAVVQEATGPAGALANYFVVASDAVSPDVTLNYNHRSGGIFPLGTTLVTVTASDGKNSTPCQFSLTVQDTVAPRLTCPRDMVFPATSAEPIPLNYSLSVEDAVTPNPEVITEHPPGSLFPVGDTEVKITAKDAAGNSSTCSFQVRNVDSEAPVITCPGPQQGVASKPEGAVVHFPEATATDNLDATTVSYSQEPGSTFPVGETVVTATAKDAGQNTASCTFTVTVLEGGSSAAGGCQAGASSGSLWWLGLAVLPLWARRRARRLTAG
ncbi:MAG: ELWxxDGT repeat protein [Hyalangium sp.]|uniref:ELWxxDGT repeat protein n=1 Tax=Hyalangium sp. TaxID=2028555 RepID=UPI003899C7F0